MVWNRDSQGRDPNCIEDATSFNVTLRLSIPLRHDDDGSVRTPAIFRFGREETRARYIVFRCCGLNGTRPGKLIAIQLEVADCGNCIKAIAVGKRLFSVAAENIARIVAVDMFNDKGEAPLKGPHFA